MFASLFVALALSAAAWAMPQQTPAPTTTTAPPSSITAAPASTAALTCTDGSTVLTTTVCTIGTTTSYCHKDPPPISCSAGFFGGVWSPGHCEVASTCYPVTAPWITRSCTNGAQTVGASTLYEGAMPDGSSTTLVEVSCGCAATQYTSYASGSAYCMPLAGCPTDAGLATSTSTNAFCAATPTACPGLSPTTALCACEDPHATPVYPAPTGSGTPDATACAAATSA